MGNNASSILSPPIASRIAEPISQPAKKAPAAAQNLVANVVPPASAGAVTLEDIVLFILLNAPAAFLPSVLKLAAKLSSVCLAFAATTIPATAPARSINTSTSFSVMLSHIFLNESPIELSALMALSAAHEAIGFKNLSQSLSFIIGAAFFHTAVRPLIPSDSVSRNAGIASSIVQSAIGSSTSSHNVSKPSPTVSAKGSSACSNPSNAVNSGSKSMSLDHSAIFLLMFSLCLRMVLKISAACCITSVPRLFLLHARFSAADILPIAMFMFVKLPRICEVISSPVPFVHTSANELPISLHSPSD